MAGRPVALLTDFGARDWYVAALKGVILSRAPGVQIIDITHEIPPQDIVAGALTLAGAARWFPTATVFLAVVDPGVGTRRRLVAAKADGRYFVGPDNGLLSPALAGARALRAVALERPAFWLRPVSRTFHGRDILAPVGAYLARGGELGRLGPPAGRLAALALPRPVARLGVLRGAVIHIDAFGNLVTNIPEARVGSAPAAIRCHGRAARLVGSYTAGKRHELIAVIGSLGLLELAVADGSAARALRAKRGDAIELRPGRA